MVLGTSTIVRVKEQSLSVIPHINLHPKVATCEQIIKESSFLNFMGSAAKSVMTNIYCSWSKTRQKSKRGTIRGVSSTRTGSCRLAWLVRKAVTSLLNSRKLGTAGFCGKGRIIRKLSTLLFKQTLSIAGIKIQIAVKS